MSNSEPGSAPWWEQFAKGWLAPEDRPTPRQAADYAIALHSRIHDLETQLRRSETAAERERADFNARLQQFALDVGNMADRLRKP